MAFSRFFQFASSTAGAGLVALGFQNNSFSSASLVNNVTSKAMELLSSSGMNNGTDDDDQSTGIDFSSKSAVIGISCIAASMVVITSFCCMVYGRVQQDKKMTLRVIVTKTSAQSDGDSIIIPELKIHRLLTDLDRDSIKIEGLRLFLKYKVAEIVEEIKAAGEDVEKSASIKQVIEVFLDKEDLTEKLGRHDLLIDVEITLKPDKHCHFFERVLPPLTRATMFFELTFGLVQDIGALQLSPSILPVSRETSNDIAITQVVLTGIFMLMVLYAGAGQVFIGDFGASIDRFFHRSCKRKKKNAIKHDSEPEEKEIQESIPTSVRCKIRFTQGMLVIFLLNNLYTQVITDYQTTMSLTDQINSQPDSMIPAWAVFTFSMAEFGLNQLNDPVNLISTVYMGGKLIDLYFTSKHKKAKAHAKEISDKAVAEEKNDTPLLLVDERQAPSSLQRFGKFARVSLSSSSLDEVVIDIHDDNHPVGSLVSAGEPSVLQRSLSYTGL